MKKRIRLLIEIFSLVIILLLLTGYPIYFFILNGSDDVKHESNRWAIIEDENGDKIAIEIDDDFFWNAFIENYKEIKKYDIPLSIIGVIISYDNLWQFRFDPSEISTRAGITKGQPRTISQITNYLEEFLSETQVLHTKSVAFFSLGYNGLILDILAIVLSIVLFVLYLFFKDLRQPVKIKDPLLEIKGNL